jgi:tetratricopeptide (TPR) repeat protein
MFRNRVILSCAGVLLFGMCAGKKPPLPEREITSYGEAAAKMFSRGEFTGALERYKKALAEAERFDNTELQARYRFNIGRIYYESAFYDSARYWFGKSGAMFTRMGRRNEAAVSEVFSAMSIAIDGDIDEARKQLIAAEPDIASGDRALYATALAYLGLLCGDSCAVNRSAEEALELFAGEKDYYGCGVVYYYKGMSFLVQRRMEAARNSLDSSLHFFGISPYRYRNWKTLLGHALLAYCEGDRERGDHYYDRAQKAVPAMVRFPDRQEMRECGILTVR